MPAEEPADCAPPFSSTWRRTRSSAIARLPHWLLGLLIRLSDLAIAETVQAVVGALGLSARSLPMSPSAKAAHIRVSSRQSPNGCSQRFDRLFAWPVAERGGGRAFSSAPSPRSRPVDSAIVGNGGQENGCDWCKDRWGVSWQITPRALTEAMAAGGDEARRAFEAMLTM